jgi:hypothetical protein
MSKAIALGAFLVVLGGNPSSAQGLAGQEKQILPLIKSSWIAFTVYTGRQFIYFSNMLAYRCGLAEIRYSINSQSLNQKFPLPPCDATNPQALDTVKYPPFVTLPLGTAKELAVQAVFKDGSNTDIVRFKPCAGEATCAILVE